MRALLAAAAVCALLAPAHADQILGTPRIDNSGCVLLPGGPQLGCVAGGKYTFKPDAIQLQSSGSTGSVSEMSATASGATASQTLGAWLTGLVWGTPTVSTLRAVPRLAIFDGAILYAGGYASVGDGGGGHFRWSASSTAADDGALTLAPTGTASPGRWLRIIDGPLSVSWFGALGNGASDAAPAFRAAIASRPAGSVVRLAVPAGTYRLDSNVEDVGRRVTVVLLDGAKIGASNGGLGSGVLYVSRVEQQVGSALVVQQQGGGSADSQFVVGNVSHFINNGGTAGFGEFVNYHNYNTSSSNSNGGDIAYHVRAEWHSLSGTGLFTTWEVGIGPKFTDAELAAGANYGLVGKEIDVVKHGPNAAWSEFDARSTVAGIGVPCCATAVGLQIAPDAWTPTGRLGGNADIGFAVFPDPVLNNRTPQSFNGTNSPFHVGNDAVAPGGRGMYFGGSTTGNDADLPHSAVEARHRWPMFLDLTASSTTLTTGHIVYAKTGMNYGWTTPVGDVTIGADSAGSLVVTESGPAMIAYTPTVYAGPDAVVGTVTAKYKRVGKMLDLTISVPITTAASGFPYVSVALPAGMTSDGAFTLAGHETNNVTAKGLYGAVKASNPYAIEIRNYDSSYPAVNGAVLQVSGRIAIQ